MNVVKIQQDLIKDALNDKAKKNGWGVQVNDSEVAINTRYNVYLLDPKDFILDANQLVGKGVGTPKIVESILKNADDAKPAYKTGKLKIVDKKTCLELKIEGSEELVYLDQALLKLYDKSAEFEAINHKSLVYVYESDILVGVVLPVNVGV